jgi:hypothetical protein
LSLNFLHIILHGLVHQAPPGSFKPSRNPIEAAF